MGAKRESVVLHFFDIASGLGLRVLFIMVVKKEGIWTSAGLSPLCYIGD